MATKAAVLPKKDAFAVMGEAIAAASDAMKKSTSDARRAASRAAPAVGSALAKTVYIAAYYASYGVVFAAVTVGRLVPSENALAYGIRDGAAAARDARTGSGRAARPVRLVASKRSTRRRQPR